MPSEGCSWLADVFGVHLWFWSWFVAAVFAVGGLGVLAVHLSRQAQLGVKVAHNSEDQPQWLGQTGVYHSGKNDYSCTCKLIQKPISYVI